MESRRLGATLALLLIGALSVISAPTAHAAADCAGMGTGGEMVLGQCPPTPAASSSASPSPSAASSSPASASPSSAGGLPSAGGQGALTGSTVQPTTAPQEWAVAASGGVSDLASEVAKNSSDSAKWDQVLRGAYPVTFAIGLFLFAVVIAMNLAKAARMGARPEERALLQGATWKMVLYAPLMMVVPGTVMWLMVLLQQLGDQAWTSSTVNFSTFLTRLGEAFGKNPLDVIINRDMNVFLLIIAAVLLLICLLLWLIQGWVAQLAVLALVLLVPVVFALAAQPKQQHRISRLVGVLAGAMLTPFISRFMFWALGPAIADAITSEVTPTIGVFKFVVFMAVVTSAPLLLSMVMPHLIDGAGSVAGGMGAGMLLGQAGQHVMDAGQRLVQKYGKSGSQAASSTASSSSGAAAASSGAGAGAAGGGAAAGGGGAAAGLGVLAAPLLLAAAGVAAGQALTNTARGQTAGVLAASGGGHTNDQQGGVHVPQLRDQGRPPADRTGRDTSAGQQQPKTSSTPTPPASPTAPQVRQNPPVAGGDK